MTIDDWRARYDGLNAETDQLRAEVERLREHEARARWCEETKANVIWLSHFGMWVVTWRHDIFGADQSTGLDRNAAIDAARGKV